MDDFVMKKKKKSDTEEGEKDQGGERSDDSAETETESMPTSSASASVEDLGQSKSKKKIVIRAFKQEWKVGRPWLVYEKGLMFCSICREGKLITAKGSEKTNALIAGTDNIKLETIKLHEGTRQHQSASKEKKQRHACVEISSRN